MGTLYSLILQLESKSNGFDALILGLNFPTRSVSLIMSKIQFRLHETYDGLNGNAQVTKLEAGIISELTLSRLI